MVNNTVFFTGVMYLGSVIQWSVGGGGDKFFPVMMLILFSLTVLFFEIKNKG